MRCDRYSGRITAPPEITRDCRLLPLRFPDCRDKERPDGQGTRDHGRASYSRKTHLCWSTKLRIRSCAYALV